MLLRFRWWRWEVPECLALKVGRVGGEKGAVGWKVDDKFCVRSEGMDEDDGPRGRGGGEVVSKSE
jgi:hypothetical protein